MSVLVRDLSERAWSKVKAFGRITDITKSNWSACSCILNRYAGAVINTDRQVRVASRLQCRIDISRPRIGISRIEDIEEP